MGVADLVLVLLRAPPAPLLTKICHCDLHRKVPDLLCLLKVYPEGTHIVIPWFERPIIYNVRARPNLVESTSGSRDLQMVPTPGIGLRCGCTRGCSTLSTRRYPPPSLLDPIFSLVVVYGSYRVLLVADVMMVC